MKPKTDSTKSTETEDDAKKMMDGSSKEMISISENGDFECQSDGDYGYQIDENRSLQSGNTQEHSRKKIMNAEMLSYKQQGSYDSPEDVYAFITVAPVCSAPFMFAVVVIGIKYVIYSTLLAEIDIRKFENEDGLALAVKFFLIPVTVAMQEDLMAVYARLANARYDEKVLDISGAATKNKFILAYTMQLIDGLLSLVVNFLKMLSTDDILDVFLNFAALHFLQDIDDVFYALVEKGFFGDDMEHMANVCKQISWPRRTGPTKFSQFLTNLDSLLFFLTFCVCLAVYITAVILT